MKTYLLPFLAMLVCLAASCAPQAPRAIIPPPVPKIVTVTDPSPAVRVVERQTARLESKVNDTAAKVATIEEGVTKSVEEAIRSGDVAREAEAKQLQTQIRELRLLADTAAISAKELQEDVKETQAALSKVVEERAAAYAEAEAIRQTLTNERSEHVATVSRLDEKKAAETKRANEWRKRAALTWAAISAILLIVVGLKVLFPGLF